MSCINKALKNKLDKYYDKMSYILNSEKVRELSWKRSFPKQTKARIIPYYVKNDSCYFLLGRERFNMNRSRGLYNSLGGRREFNETIFNCARRELKEESIGIFNLDDFPIQKSVIMQRNRRYIIFIPFTGNIKDINEKFVYRKGLIKNRDFDQLSKIMDYTVDTSNINYIDEIEDLMWVSEYSINKGKHIFRSVIDVFQHIIVNNNKNIGFSGFLDLLKKNYINYINPSTEKIKVYKFDVIGFINKNTSN